MSKISSIQNSYLSNINKTKIEEDKQANQKTETSSNKISDSVVADFKPEVESIEAASFIVDKITSKLESSPSNALSAQGDLDEAKVLALLSDDD